MSQVTPFTQKDQIKVSKSGVAGFMSILHFGRKRKWPLVGAIGVIFLSSLCVLFSAKNLGHLVENLAKVDAENMSAIAWLGASFLGLEVLNILFKYIGRTWMAKVSNYIIYDLRCDLLDKMNRLPIAYYDMQPIGRTITRLTSDVLGVETLFVNSLGRLLVAGFSIISVFCAMIFINPIFGGAIVLSVIPAVILNFVTQDKTRERMRDFKGAQSKANARLAELISGMFLIRLFHLEKWSYRLYESDVIKFYHECIRFMNWNTWVRPLIVLLCAIPSILVFYFAGHQVIEGTMELGMFVMYIRYCETFLEPVRSISQELHQIQDAFSSAERVDQMMQEREEKDIFPEEGDYGEPIKGSVEFRNITKSYIPGKPVLKSVSFKVNPGEKIGFVGATGSGKSSTLNLIPKLYDYEEGQLLIDDVDIHDWSKAKLRSQLGVVSQDVVMFRGSLRENLLGAVKDPSMINEQELQHAMELTGLKVVVDALPMGIETEVIEGGENFSQGEKQLISLTRMLIRDPAILLMDEATASVDEENELIIQNAVERVMKNRTCFIIAHRLSTIVHCDHILVFKNGEIVEKGKHQELIDKGGVYAALAKTQLH